MFYRSLVSDGFAKLSMRVGFTAMLVYVFQCGFSTFDLGVVSVASVVPSIFLALFSGRLTLKYGSRKIYLASLSALSVLLCLIPFSHGSFIALAVFSGAIGLMQQMSMASKLAYDASIVGPEVRTKYNSKRAFLSGITTIVGPSAAGFIGGYWGGQSALVLAGVFAVVAVLFLVKGYPENNIWDNPEDSIQKNGVLVQAKELFRWLVGGGDREILIQLVTYIVIMGIMQMEAPLIFPFVKEVYHLGVNISGTLLGICGVGSLFGATVMHVYSKPIRSMWLMMVLAFDGFVLLFISYGFSLAVTYFLFAFLGIISSVALVTVETQVQSEAPAKFHTFIFSIMSFVGGVGGASLTLASTSVADVYGSAMVLRGCAYLEVIVSAVATVGILAFVGNRKVVRELCGKSDC